MGKIARITNDGKLLIKGKLIEKVKEEPLLYFNGASQAVTIDNTNNRLQPSNTFTWEAWFKLDGYTQYNSLMGFGGNNFDFGRMDSTTRFRCHTYDVNGSNTFLNPSGFQPVDDGEWHHMAIVWDGESGERFALIDGIQRDYGTMATGSQPRDLSSHATFTIGGSTPNGRLINGWIKDVRMWQIARTQQEIVDSMDAKLVGDEEGLFLYLPLDEGKGETVVDKASGFEANINGAIWESDTKTLGLDTGGNINLFGELIEMEVKVQSKNLVRNGNYEYGEIEPWVLYNGAQLSWDEEVGAYLFQGVATRNDLAYQELTLEPHTAYTLSLITQRQYGNTAIRILRSLEGEDYIANIGLMGTSPTPTSATFLTEGQTQYYISFASTGVNRRGYAKEIQLEKGDIASEYASYGEVMIEDNLPLIRFKDGKVYIKGELIEEVIL